MTFMSSPKRAAKTAERTSAKRNGKLAPRRQTVAVPAKPAANGASVDAKRLAATLERGIADGKLDLLSAEALQKLIAAACRVYSARTEAGEQFTPVPKHSISATDVMLTASGLLRAADLAVFELGMWQSWTGR
jgi:hypothetical protein